MLESRTWTPYSQDSSGVPGVAEAGDRFGASVAHGLGCKSATDESWAVGAPGEDIGSVKDAGSVTLRDRSTGRGITLQQGGLGIPGGREPGDGFGSTLADAGVLVIGAPREDIGTAKDAGLVTLVELGCNAAQDLRPDVSSAWNQATTGVPGTAGTGDLFGQGLGAALVSVAGGSLELRLVVGSPGEDDGDRQRFWDRHGVPELLERFHHLRRPAVRSRERGHRWRPRAWRRLRWRARQQQRPGALTGSASADPVLVGVSVPTWDHAALHHGTRPREV